MAGPVESESFRGGFAGYVSPRVAAELSRLVAVESILGESVVVSESGVAEPILALRRLRDGTISIGGAGYGNRPIILPNPTGGSGTVNTGNITLRGKSGRYLRQALWQLAVAYARDVGRGDVTREDIQELVASHLRRVSRDRRDPCHPKALDEAIRLAIVSLLDLTTWDLVFRLTDSVSLNRYNLVHQSRDVWTELAASLPGAASWALLNRTVNHPPESASVIVQAVQRELFRYGLEERHWDYVASLPCAPLKVAATQSHEGSAAVLNFIAALGIVPSGPAVSAAAPELSYTGRSAVAESNYVDSSLDLLHGNLASMWRAFLRVSAEAIVVRPEDPEQAVLHVDLPLVRGFMMDLSVLSLSADGLEWPQLVSGAMRLAELRRM